MKHHGFITQLQTASSRTVHHLKDGDVCSVHTRPKPLSVVHAKDSNHLEGYKISSTGMQFRRFSGGVARDMHQQCQLLVVRLHHRLLSRMCSVCSWQSYCEIHHSKDGDVCSIHTRSKPFRFESSGNCRKPARPQLAGPIDPGRVRFELSAFVRSLSLLIASAKSLGRAQTPV